MTMILKETIPEPVERALQKASEGPQVKISVATDIGHDGRFGEQWLVVTDSDVMVFSPNGDEVLLDKKLLLSDLIEVKVQSLIGGSALEVSTSSGGLIELLQYSNLHATKFATAAKWLNQVVKGEEVTPVTEKVPARCPKCGPLLREDSKGV